MTGAALAEAVRALPRLDELGVQQTLSPTLPAIAATPVRRRGCCSR